MRTQLFCLLGFFAFLSLENASICQNPFIYPAAYDGHIRGMARVGDTVYVAANMPNIMQLGGAFCAFDVNTGAFTDRYNPGDDGRVRAILQLQGSSSRMMLGGEALANDENTIVIRDTATNEFDLQFPTVSGRVRSLEQYGDTIFVGGTFSSIGYFLDKLVIVDQEDLLPEASLPLTGTVYETISLSDGRIALLGDLSYEGGSNFPLTLVNTDGTYESSVASNTNYTARFGVERNGMLYYLTRSSSGLTKINRFDLATNQNSLFYDIGSASPILYGIDIVGDSLYIFNLDGPSSTRSVTGYSLTQGTITPFSAFTYPGGGGTNYTVHNAGDYIYMAGNFAAGLFAPGSSAHLIRLNRHTMQVDLTWQPQVDSSITMSYFDNGQLVLVGTFTTILGQARRCVAVVDAVTGQLRPWSLNLGGIANPQVTAVPFGQRILVTTSNTGVTLDGVPMFPNAYHSVDTVNGNILPAYELEIGTLAYRVALGNNRWALTPQPGANSSSTVNLHNYNVRAFTAFRLSTRKPIYTITGTTLSNDSVNIMQITPNGELLVAGNFAGLMGQSQPDLARLSLPAVTVQPFAFSTSTSGYINDFALHAGKLYLGGSFSTVNGVARANLAALDWPSTTLSTSLAGGANGIVHSVALFGDSLYVGGAFTTLHGTTSSRFGCINLINGLVTTLNAPTVATSAFICKKIIATQDSLYILYTYTGTLGGGEFIAKSRQTSLGNAFRYVFDAYSQTLEVMELGSQQGKLLLGGNKLRLHILTPNRRMYAFRLSTGELCDFSVTSPGATDTIYSIIAVGDTVYYGGRFNSSSLSTTAGVGAFRASTGQPVVVPGTSSSGTVKKVLNINGIIHVGGIFNQFGGVSATNYGLFQQASSALVASPPTFNSPGVNNMLQVGDSVYVLGGFTTVNGQSRNRLALFTLQPNLSLTPWNANITSLTFANAGMFANNDEVFILSGGVYQGFNINGATSLMHSTGNYTSFTTTTSTSRCYGGMALAHRPAIINMPSVTLGTRFHFYQPQTGIVEELASSIAMDVNVSNPMNLYAYDSLLFVTGRVQLGFWQVGLRVYISADTFLLKNNQLLNDTVVCGAQAITLNPLNTNTYADYVDWSLNGSSVISSTTSALGYTTPVIALGDSLHIWYRFRDSSSGLFGHWRSIWVHSRPSAAPSFNLEEPAVSSICQLSSLSYAVQNLQPDNQFAVYNWEMSFNGGAFVPATGATNSPIYAGTGLTPGNYVFRVGLSVTGLCLTADTLTLTSSPITIDPAQTTSLSITNLPGSNQVCDDVTHLLGFNLVGGTVAAGFTDIAWLYSNNNPLPGTNDQSTYDLQNLNSGTANIKLVITGISGYCLTNTSLTVTVPTLTIVQNFTPTASMTGITGATYQHCVGMSHIVTATIGSGQNANTALWLYGSTSNPTTPAPGTNFQGTYDLANLPTGLGYLRVLVSDYIGCPNPDSAFSFTAPVNVTTNSILPSITINGVPTQPVYYMQAPTLTSTLAGATSATYSWYKSTNGVNFQFIVGSSASTYNLTDLGPGTFWMVVRASNFSGNLCSSSTMTTDTVGPFVLNPTVGFSDSQETLQIVVHPNPSTGMFTLNNPLGKALVLTIVDGLGRAVWNGIASEAGASRFVVDVPSGVYRLLMRTPDGTITTTSLVFQQP